MPKTKKFKEKYITYDGIKDNFKVRVPGFKQVIRKTDEEAIAERNRLMEAKSVGRINIDPDTTIGDWIELFLQEHCKNLYLQGNRWLQQTVANLLPYPLILIVRK